MHGRSRSRFCRRSSRRRRIAVFDGAVGIVSVLLVASFSQLAPEEASDQQAAHDAAPPPRFHQQVHGEAGHQPHYPRVTMGSLEGPCQER